jgi:hypothetical protein
MRTGFLLPLAALVIAGAAGCSRQGGEESAALLQRDLTRVDAAPNVEVASSLELQQPPTTQIVQPRATIRAVRASRRPRIDPKPMRAVLATHTAVAAPSPEAKPTPIEEPLSDRELLPGKTVTIIPVGSGPSTATDPGEDVGLTMIRQGHRCPPARPGIGIATRPPGLVLD